MSKVIIDKDPNSPKDPITFHCWRCGACCQTLAGIEEFAELDDGTGTCIHFDRKSRNCLIYENRPLMCDVWGLYNEFYKDDMTEEEYAIVNIKSCRELRAELGLPEPELLIARKKAREAAAKEFKEKVQQQKRSQLPRQQVRPQSQSQTQVRSAQDGKRERVQSTQQAQAQKGARKPATRQNANAAQGQKNTTTQTQKPQPAPQPDKINETTEPARDKTSDNTARERKKSWLHPED